MEEQLKRLRLQLAGLSIGEVEALDAAAVDARLAKFAADHAAAVVQQQQQQQRRESDRQQIAATIAARKGGR